VKAEIFAGGLKLAVNIPHWHDEATCAQIGPDLWIPEQVGMQYMASAEAKKVCNDCPVRLKCGIEAIELRDEFTVRAGFSTHTASGRTELKQWLRSQGVEVTIREDAEQPKPTRAANGLYNGKPCFGCNRILVPTRTPAPIPEGHIRHCSGGWCDSCRKRELRAGRVPA
jgi:hypothetical protein